MVLATEEKVLLALVPRAVMAVMDTTTIRASITAYSTAVGPSSSMRNCFALASHFDIRPSLSLFRGRAQAQAPASPTWPASLSLVKVGKVEHLKTQGASRSRWRRGGAAGV